MINNIQRFFDMIQVYDCDLTKIRLGSPHDGGYVIYEEPCNQAKALYSFGIGDDVNFELDFITRFPESWVFLFDPSIDAPPQNHPRFAFSQKGFGFDVQVGVLTCPLVDSILKIDTEWAEWNGLQSFERDALVRCSQVVVEFHIVHVETVRNDLSPYFTQFYQAVWNEVNESLFSKYAQVLEKLSELFYIFHIHVNNSLPKLNVNKFHFPPLLEVSFVRKDLAVNVRKSTQSFPIEGLDKPNKTDRPDITDFCVDGEVLI